MKRGLRLEPIGVARSRFKEPADLPPPAFAPRGFFERSLGTVEVRSEFAPGLDRIEDYSHIVVLFHFHRAGYAKLKVTPPGQKKERGVFASRSPHRPNPLGMSVLKLLRRDGRILHVSGLDLIDGTPVLDIKPYTRRDRKSRIRTADSNKAARAAR